MGGTCPELNIGHCKIKCPKTKFSMVIPDVQDYLNENGKRKSIVLFGIEVGPSRVGLVSLEGIEKYI